MTTLRSLVLLAAVAGCSPGPTSSSSAPRPGAAAEGSRVEVALVEPSDATFRLGLTGEVHGVRDASLGSALGGFVEDVRVRTGATVKRGELLVAVDREMHGAGHRQADAQAALAKSELARMKRLGDGISASQLDQAEAQAKVAEAALSQASVRLRRASIVAPFDGVVSAVAIEQGEILGPGAPVLRVVQLDPVKVVAAVSDLDVVSIDVGTPAAVTAGAVGGSFQGEVVRMSPVGDDRTRSFQIEIEVPNPDHRLLPGMVSRVAIERPLGRGIVVPTDWVLSTPVGHGVFVEVDGAARWRPVTLGRIIQNRVVIDEGLSAGDAVIMVGHRELIDGDPVLVARRGRCCTDGRVTYDAVGVN